MEMRIGESGILNHPFCSGDRPVAVYLKDGESGE